MTPSEHRANGPSHLGPALCALAAAAALLGSVQAFVARRLPGSLPFYAAYAMSFKVNANVLQTLAFRTPDELPIYGSSELDQWVENRADAFFSRRPTGFAVFPVGRGGSTCLLIQQKLAAVGDAARGKKVVIFLSPAWFLEARVGEDEVRANLSGAQLSAWVFGHDLSPALKRDISRRLRDSWGALEAQGLNASAVECLAEPTPVNRLRFAVLSPLGKVQNALLEKFDYGVLLWEIVFFNKRWSRIEGYAQNAPTANGERIDWEHLAALAEANDRQHREGTVPGDTVRPGEAAGDDPRASDPRSDGPDRDFASRLNASREFGDLALLIRVLKELRMEALFISQPIDGRHRDAQGITSRGRRAYYERIEACLRSAGYPLKDFSDHEEDPYFFKAVDHPSGKAWIFYDREIDRFYAHTGDRQVPID